MPLDDAVRARQADALPLEDEPREDEVRCRRADVDADRPQLEALRRDVARVVLVVDVAVRMTPRAVRARRPLVLVRQAAVLRRGR